MKKLVSKVVSKENIYYRKLTDKPEVTAADSKEGESEARNESMDIDDVSKADDPALDDETLSKGSVQSEIVTRLP